MRKKNGLVYSTVIRDTWVWGVALRMGRYSRLVVDAHMEYTDIRADGERETAAKDYVEFFYKIKSTRGLDANTKTIVKLFLNSLYGKWGQRKFEKHTYCTEAFYD